MLLQEAAEFMDFDTQTRLSSIVERVKYSDEGVAVLLKDNTTINAAHVLVTFSMGVLQTTDVEFAPPLPDWKFEAIQTIKVRCSGPSRRQPVERAPFPTEGEQLTSLAFSDGDLHQDFLCFPAQVLAQHGGMRNLPFYDLGARPSRHFLDGHLR